MLSEGAGYPAVLRICLKGAVFLYELTEDGYLGSIFVEAEPGTYEEVFLGNVLHTRRRGEPGSSAAAEP